MPIRLGNLPYDLLVSGDDFVAHGSRENLIFSGVVLFVTLLSLEISTSLVLSFIPSSILKEPGVKRKLARNLNESAAMIVMSWLGYVAFIDQGGFQYASSGIGIERLYVFNGLAQRLALFQTVYEVKNFLNSFMWGDGWVYLFHHIFTGLVALFAMHPFLHFYASYFLGLSEVSTIFLCLYVCFEDQYGTKSLIPKFPTAHTVLGLLFALGFCIFRITLWIYFAFYLCSDLITLYYSGQAHNLAILAFYFISTFLMTILQIVWLSDIISAAKSMFVPSAEVKKKD